MLSGTALSAISFFPKRMPLQSLLRPCLPVRFAAAHQTAGRAASASPPVSHRPTQIGPYRCALPADFFRPPAGCPLLFSHQKRLLFLPIEQDFQPFQFFNRKSKAPCAAVKGL